MKFKDVMYRMIKIFFIILMCAIISYSALAYTEISSCGAYNIVDDIAVIQLDNVNITASPCLELSMSNSTIYCDRDIIGNWNVFAYISMMNNSIIQDCNMSSFIQGFLIPDSYYVVGYTENNIFRNIHMTSISSALFGFDIRAEYGQFMNHTEFYDNYVESCYDNQAFSFYASGMDDLYIHDNIFNGTYSGIIDYYSTNIEISNNDFISGTIFGILLTGVYRPILRDNYIEGYAVCGIGLNAVTQAYLYNNRNDLQTGLDGNLKFCLGEYESTIDSLSSYNLGWFTKDYTDTITTYSDELSLYNLSNSYDVVFNDSNYELVYNASKSYFIFPDCIPEWIKQPTSCIDGISLDEYYDDNDCNLMTGLPVTNNTYQYCYLTTHQTMPEDYLILGILFLLLVISLACAVTVHEGFFGLCAVITGLMMSVFIMYDYPPLLMIPLGLMTLLFVVMWIVINKVRR
jgi:parallel beta-helix repeat protein